MKTQKHFYFTQICLRILVISTTLAAASVMFTSKQSTVVFGSRFEARYSYSSAFKFFAIANAVACAFSFLSLLYILIVCQQHSNPSHYFFLFLHDLLMMLLVMAGCAAATAVGYIGKYGNSHIGWMGICKQFGKFCNRVTTSVVLSYLSVIFLLVLTIANASRSRHS